MVRMSLDKLKELYRMELTQQNMGRMLDDLALSVEGLAEVLADIEAWFYIHQPASPSLTNQMFESNIESLKPAKPDWQSRSAD